MLFSVLVIISISAETQAVFAPPPLTYTLTPPTSRIVEANSPGVLMTLNVSNTTPGSLYGFSWNVTDPSGGVSSYFSGAAANGPVLTLNAVFPRDFSGASVKYNGTYPVNVFQTYPNPTPVLVATAKIYAGLTDLLSYRRITQVSILAQGYSPSENITIRIWHAGVLVSGFPKSQLANGNGIFSYSWPIPFSAPLGNFNVSLSGQATVKKPPDSQIFAVLPTTVSISKVAADVTLQGSQIATFSFAANYPDGSQAKSGTATIQVLEPDGITIHPVSVSYNTTLSSFQGIYRLSPSSSVGGWVAIVGPNSFDDGYGNTGPTASVVRGFVVGPDVSQNLQNLQAATITYLFGVVALLAAALAILGLWTLYFGKRRVQRNVLKVDFEPIEKEAARVENREFFVKLQDQMKHRQQTGPEEETKDG
jgi:hypothetical protein